MLPPTLRPIWRGAAFAVVLAIVVLTPARSPAQPKDQPYAVLSERPDLPSAKKPDPMDAVKNVLLRPNSERSLYLYVHNPTDEDRKVVVQVLTADTRTVLGQQSLTLAPDQTQRVVLAAPPAPQPPAGEAPKPGVPAKPADTLTGTLLTGPSFALKVQLRDENNKLLSEETLPLGIVQPSQYVSLGRPTFDVKDDGTNRLTVPVGVKVVDGKGQLKGLPCPVRLDLSRVPGLVAESVKSAALEGKLEPDGKLTLFAADLKFSGEPDREGILSLTVDGCERAFRFQTTFPKQVAEKPLTTPRLTIVAPALARPGKPYPVRLEVDDPPAEAAFLELGEDRANDGTFVTQRFPVRAQRVALRLGGKNDALVFATEQKDRVVNLETTGLLGAHYLRLRLLDKDDKQVEAVREIEQKVVLDASPPENVRFSKLPKQVVRGRPLLVGARATDAESGVKQAVFFLGEPPPLEGKPPVGAVVVEGTRDGKDQQLWTARLPLPADAKGQLKLGVRFVNGVGLDTTETVDLELVDPPPPLGSIKGVVFVATVRQPKLEVVLRKGQETIQTVRTNEKGEFTIKDLAPGSYTVVCVKAFDRAKDQKTVNVVAGTDPAEVELRLKR